MKRFLLFLLLFLVPRFIFALGQEDYDRILWQINADWKKHTELIQQFKRLKPSEIDVKICLLNDSKAHCEQALINDDKILNDIARKHKDKRKEFEDIKKICEKIETFLLMKSAN